MRVYECDVIRIVFIVKHNTCDVTFVQEDAYSLLMVSNVILLYMQAYTLKSV